MSVNAKTQNRLYLVGGSIMIWALTIGAAVAESAAEELTVVFIAYQNPEQVLEDVQPVVEYLESALHMKIRHFVATDYAGIIEALRNGTADMGFMGPLQYVLAHRHAGARVILGEVYNGKSYYTSRIFVRRDSGIKNVGDLRGKTIAFVDPVSSSGYLYPMDLFKREGLLKSEPEEFFKRAYFAGGDEQAIRAVFNGFVDSAGIGQFAYNLLRPEERDAVIFIGESRRLPSHCIVVREGMSEARIQQLQETLLALNDGEHHGLLQYLYGVDGYVRVTHEDFAEVEEVARSFGLIK
ncbi:MAG: phosphate/phosphite/phosphonate ABC transporter substrate-binding protein [Candidatus Hydrogenedentes bacterium]|nr:phosphate/phosphite/phosphonate ABC transporter substrate-binding protein [Candidatus Hydrogenedentota bacterium]